MHHALVVAHHHDAQRDSFDAPGCIANANHIAHSELIFDQDEEPGEDVLYNRLSAERDGDSHDAGTSEQGTNVQSHRIENHEQADNAYRHQPNAANDAENRTNALLLLGHAGLGIFDSPANNATAHFLHNMFYLLGATRETSAAPAVVQAELYRANAIENFDTAAIRFAAAHDYIAFADDELRHRQAAGLPPITRLARVVIRDQHLEKAEQHANELAALLRAAAPESDLTIDGPVPCTI
jgi:hypothetical protein